jgi:hypothetical protein
MGSCVTLVILGAGCSLNSGYPLANSMFNCLSKFLECSCIGDSTVRLRECVIRTLDLVANLKKQSESVETLDTLARLIHEGKAGGATMTERSRDVVSAKIAVTALFLSLERAAIKKQLPGYRQFLERVFGKKTTGGYKNALGTSNFRILTFNYDRLFELAFRDFFPDFDDTIALYCPDVLNSGLFLVDSENVHIETNKFSFLKLHGSAGLYGFSQSMNPSDKNSGVDHHHSIPDPKKPTIIGDDEFFLPNDPGYGIHAGKAKPVLITFPHEKDHLKEYPANLLPFKVYTPKIWGAAANFASQADEIHLIGYSCPGADAPALVSLFSAAKNTVRYRIQNPAPDEVRQRLYSMLPTNFSGDVFCDATPF